MKLTEIYNSGKQVLSFEIFPPKKEEDFVNITDTLDILCELKPAYISVTFGAGGSSNKNKTIEIAKLIRDRYGVTPVVHLTCLCYDKSEIDEFIDVLRAEGINNILALRGDENPNVPAKSDFKHASDLISYLKSKGDFCIAGACYPEMHPDSNNRIEDIRNLKKKVDAGADILLSQLFFENENFYDFVDNCRIAGIDVPITPGIMPVLSEANIRRMTTMCGAKLTPKFERIISRYGNDPVALVDAGINYAVSQIIDLLANGCDGIHLYTMNRPEVAKRICDGIKNII